MSVKFDQNVLFVPALLLSYIIEMNLIRSGNLARHFSSYMGQCFTQMMFTLSRSRVKNEVQKKKIRHKDEHKDAYLDYQVGQQGQPGLLVFRPGSPFLQCCYVI